MKKLSAPIGILGDGQLALMLGESAHKQRISFRALCDSAESSFSVSFPNESIFKKDLGGDSLASFAAQCSVLTLENEFLPASALWDLVARGNSVVPSPESYAYFASKFQQRTLYQRLGIPSPKWGRFEGCDPDQILTPLKKFSYPMVMKASSGGYDGYGVRVVNQESEARPALEALQFFKGKEIILEEKVQIAREFAQGALFDGAGGVNFLPCVETIQKNGICEVVLSHSDLAHEKLAHVQAEIKKALLLFAKAGLHGLFNFEFFYTVDGRVLINEGAPRPHNSQHLTINASDYSQFDLLISFLANGTLPLPDQTSIAAKPSAMINLLGQSSGVTPPLTLPKLPPEIEVHAKLYGKKECRPGRKMGHLVLIDQSKNANLRALAEHVLREYRL